MIADLFTNTVLHQSLIVKSQQDIAVIVTKPSFNQNGLKMEFLRTASLIAEVPHWRLNFATSERVIETLLSIEEGMVSTKYFTVVIMCH